MPPVPIKDTQSWHTGLVVARRVFPGHMSRTSAIERDPIELRHVLADDLVSRLFREFGELAVYHF